MKKSLASINKNWTLFLDRDGVINVRPIGDYVKKKEDFVFLENVPLSIQKLNKIFKYTFIVTNQQGIGKGLMSAEVLADIHNFMLEELKKNDAQIDEIFFCPYKVEENNFYRKPNIGMALAAKKKYPDINFKESVMVGDSISDMIFGKKLNMLTVFISNDLNEIRKNYRLIDYCFEDLNSLVKALHGV